MDCEVVPQDERIRRSRASLRANLPDGFSPAATNFWLRATQLKGQLEPLDNSHLSVAGTSMPASAQALSAVALTGVSPGGAMCAPRQRPASVMNGPTDDFSLISKEQVRYREKTVHEKARLTPRELACEREANPPVD